MKTINLKIAERVALVKLLPLQGSRIEMMMVESLAKTIGLSEEESNESGFSLRDGFYQWQKDLSAELEFSPEHLLLIKEGISQADKERRITRDLLPIIDRFETELLEK